MKQNPKKMWSCVVLTTMFALCLGAQSVVAQSTLTGRVTNSSGEGIMGAIVSQQGTTTGEITGADGAYSIRLNAGATRISVSYLGYVTQTIDVDGRSVINVVLQEDVQRVDDVVVTAYGRQSRGTVVGSFQSVNVESLRVPTSSLASGFAGQLSGVIAVTRSGEPGKADATNFWIRGISTFGAMQSPLIIIDGVQQTASDLNSYDPEMIESFSILKDATATALYGSRGANGVMIVTTKSGRALDKPQINVRIESSWSTPTSLPKFVDGARFMEMYNEAVASRGTGQIPYREDKIYGTRMGVDPIVFPNVDWYDEMFKKGALSQNANLSLRGGSEKMNYFSSISFHNENGILRRMEEFSFNKGLNVRRILMQNNFNVAVTPTTRMSLRINANLRTYKGSHEEADTAFQRVIDSNPVDYPIRFPSEGNFTADGLSPDNYDYILWGGRAGGSWNQGYPNAYAQMVDGVKDEFQSTVNGVIEVDQDLKFLTEGLSARALFSFKNYSKTTTIHRYAGQPGYNRFSVSDWVWNADRTAVESYSLAKIGNLITPVMEYANPNDNGSADGDRQVYMEAQINYEKRIGEKHNLSAMVIYTQEEWMSNRPTSFTSSLPKRKQSIASRLNYSYDYRYLLEANFGYNGSENFAKGHRFGLFPSIGVGWVASRENWFKPLTNIVSNLKLRASYGLVGNDSDATRFMYLSEITLSDSNLRYTTGQNQNYTKDGPRYVRFGNDNLTWEMSEKINFGIDFGLFEDSLNLSVDVFREDRTNIFMTRQNVPNVIGLSPVFPAPNQATTNLSTALYGNLGSVRNWGVEVVADYAKRFSKDFTVSFKGTFSFARNKVTSYDEPDFQQYPNLSWVGQSVNSLQMYIAERLFIDEAEIAGSPQQNIGGALKGGDIKYTDIADVNGVKDGVINSSDRVWSKYPYVPEIIYGFGPSFRYKKWDFSFFFQGAANVQFMLSGIHPFGSYAPRNVLQFVESNYYSETNNPDIYAAYPRLSIEDISNNTVNSTYWLRNGAYLKLKNAELGFNHANFRVYLRGTNLLTFSPFKYWDPEQTTNNGLANGLNRYPTQKVFNIGIQFIFK